VNKIIFIWLGLNVLWAQSEPYQQFLSYMNSDGAKVLSIEFSQEQFGAKYYSTGEFYYLGEDHYIYDSEREMMAFEDGTITTINKIDQQIIYDKTVEGEVTIFDVLSGKSEFIHTGEPLLEKNGIKIPFKLLEWDMVGYIKTVPNSGKPRVIQLTMGEESFIKIMVRSSIPLGKKKVPSVNHPTFEIIDLRE